MIRVLVFAAALTGVFWIDVFFLPALGVPTLQCTIIAVLFAARTVRQSAAAALGAWAGLLLSLVSLENGMVMTLAVLAAAACARWLSVHYFSQRSLGTTFVLFLVCTAIVWSPAVFRAAFESLSSSAHAIPLVREYLAVVARTAVFATLCHVPLLLWQRWHGVRLSSQSAPLRL